MSFLKRIKSKLNFHNGRGGEKEIPIRAKDLQRRLDRFDEDFVKECFGGYYFDRIANVKVAELIKKEGFIKIISIESEFVHLEFDVETCRVDTFGRVEWFDK